MSSTGSDLKPTLMLPDNSSGGVYHYSGLVGSVGGAVSAVYFAVVKAEPLALIAIPILLAVAYLLFRSVTTSTPSSISITADSIVLTNVPSFRIWLDNAIVPLIIQKQVSISKSDFHLEWLGQSLTWNDLQGGKSIHLAQVNEAKSLLAWLAGHGISVPPMPI